MTKANFKPYKLLMSRQQRKYYFMFHSKCDLHISMLRMCTDSALIQYILAFIINFITHPFFYEYKLHV